MYALLNNVMEQEMYPQNSDIYAFFERKALQEMYVEKEEYLDQYIENGFWAMLPLREIHKFLKRVSYNGVNKEIKEEQNYAKQKIYHIVVDNIRYIRNNYLHRVNCVKLEEKYVTALLKSNVVEIPI